MTKAGATANISNIAHKGDTVEFDATFEDAAATAKKIESDKKWLSEKQTVIW